MLSDLLGVLGNIFAISLSFSTIPTFNKIIKQQSTLEFSHFPYILIFLTSLLWSYYSFLDLDNRIYILIVTAVNIFLQSINLFIFLYFAKYRLYFIKSFTVSIVLFLIVFLSSHFSNLTDEIAGASAMVCNIFQLASPLFILKTVISTKSVEFMPLYLSIAVLLTSSTWFWWSIINDEIFVSIPNGLGILFGIIQIGVWIYYSR